MNKAMEQYYKVTNDSYFGDIYLYQIQYYKDMPPILNHDEKAIKRAANKANKPREVKNMVKLFKKYQWFKYLVFESTRNSIFSSTRLME